MKKIFKDSLNCWLFLNFYSGGKKDFSKNAKKFFKNRVRKCRFFSYRWEVFLIKKNYLKNFAKYRGLSAGFSLISEANKMFLKRSNKFYSCTPKIQREVSINSEG